MPRDDVLQCRFVRESIHHWYPLVLTNLRSSLRFQAHNTLALLFLIWSFIGIFMQFKKIFWILQFRYIFYIFRKYNKKQVLKTFSYKNTQIAYTDLGKVSALFFLHLFLESNSMWKKITKELAKKFRV